MCSERQSVIVCAAMLSIYTHSWSWYFISKTTLIFWAPSQCYKYVYTGIYSKSDRVPCFHYLHTRIANDTYHVRMMNIPYASSTMSQQSGAKAKTIASLLWECKIKMQIHTLCIMQYVNIGIVNTGIGPTPWAVSSNAYFQQTYNLPPFNWSYTPPPSAHHLTVAQWQ